MHLPNAESAIVDERKVRGYLLNRSHPDGAYKAAYFEGYGFSAEEWMGFAAALQKHAHTSELVDVSESLYGTRYVVEGKLQTDCGKHPRIKSVWIIEKTGGLPRLITAYPA